MTFLRRIFGGKRDRKRTTPLYRAVVATGRDPSWYRAGAVPDTVDGRFAMIAAVLALVLLRLEAEGEKERDTGLLLTESFIDDMDASVREMGIGDLVVGKHVGRMMSALGGRLGAFREAIAAGTSLEPAVRRNIFHDAPPSGEALGFVTGRIEAFREKLAGTPVAALIEGRMPAP